MQRKHKSHQHLPVSSLGFLNVKDVFYRRSVSELKNYDDKMRSVTSLPSAHKESIRRSNKELLKDLPEEDENEDSAATSASRAIELWRLVVLPLNYITNLINHYSFRSFKKMTDLALLAEPIFGTIFSKDRLVNRTAQRFNTNNNIIGQRISTEKKTNYLNLRFCGCKIAAALLFRRVSLAFCLDSRI